MPRPPRPRPPRPRYCRRPRGHRNIRARFRSRNRGKATNAPPTTADCPKSPPSIFPRAPRLYPRGKYAHNPRKRKAFFALLFQLREATISAIVASQATRLSYGAPFLTSSANFFFASCSLLALYSTS